MRLAVGRAIKVGPGDKVVVQARLPAGSAKLGRLFVFAKEKSNTGYSPYVAGLSSGVMADNGEPNMHSPLTLRLTEGQPTRQLKFVADIHGHIQVMQEVDTADEVLAKVKMSRQICPYIGWKEWLSRLMPW